MPANKCFSLVRGRAMRVTRLDGCGATVLGPDSTVVSDGFVTIGLTAQTDEGTTISVTNAAGRVCILDEPCPTFTGYEVSIEFCGVDPGLVNLMTGQPIITDYTTPTPEGVGFRMNSAVDACASGFALEVWSQVPTAVCTPGSGVNYGYFLIPFVKGGIIGDFTIGNDAVNFTLSGAKTKDGSSWGVGPYNVIRNATVPAPLKTAIGANDHLHMQLTAIPPPTVGTCATTANGVAATGAVAGTPGTSTPANSYLPANLADLVAGAAGPHGVNVVASPATNWTSGQYITLRDGSFANWNGTTWVAGIHA